MTVTSPAAPETLLVMATSGKPPFWSVAEIIAVGEVPLGPAGGSKAKVKSPCATPRNTRNVLASLLVTARSACPSWLKSAIAIPVGADAVVRGEFGPAE